MISLTWYCVTTLVVSVLTERMATFKGLYKAELNKHFIWDSSSWKISVSSSAMLQWNFLCKTCPTLTDKVSGMQQDGLLPWSLGRSRGSWVGVRPLISHSAGERRHTETLLAAVGCGEKGGSWQEEVMGWQGCWKGLPLSMAAQSLPVLAWPLYNVCALEKELGDIQGKKCRLCGVFSLCQYFLVHAIKGSRSVSQRLQLSL